MTVRSALQIRPARDPHDYEVARALFLEYAQQLNIDLCFQGFNDELARLPEMYGPPIGRLLLASAGAGHDPFGCVGVRALAADPLTCEMKRLYVRTDGRGLGTGRALATASLAAARDLGYARIVLDTLESMNAARALYADLGFREAKPYYANPNVGVTYLELAL